ncbi:MAG: hypothetical protein QW035_04530 [Candidatus Anstonellales archaeon]
MEQKASNAKAAEKSVSEKEKAFIQEGMKPDEFEQFLISMDPERWVKVLAKIGDEGDSKNAGLILLGLKEKDSLVRNAAKLALAMISEKGIVLSEEEIKKIRWLANSGIKHYKEAGLFALGCIGDGKDLHIVAEGLADQDFDIRKAARAAFERMVKRGVLKTKEALEAARQTAANQLIWGKKEVKGAVLLIFGEAGEKEDIDVVKREMESEENYVRRIAQLAFSKMEQRGVV